MPDLVRAAGSVFVAALASAGMVGYSNYNSAPIADGRSARLATSSFVHRCGRLLGFLPHSDNELALKPRIWRAYAWLHCERIRDYRRIGFLAKGRPSIATGGSFD